MDQLGQDFARFVYHLLTPETFGLVTALGTVLWQLHKYIKRNLEQNYKDVMDPVEKKLDELNRSVIYLKDNEKKDWKEHLVLTRDIQKEVLRLQILEGIESKRLSESEVRFFYDKYRKFGGNSFVTAKVHDYLDSLDKRTEDDE